MTRALVYLIERETNEIVLRASQVPHQVDLGNIRLKMGEGVTGWVVEHHSVVALARECGRGPPIQAFSGAGRRHLPGILSVPLVSGGEVIGVINVHHRDPTITRPDEIALLTFVGEQMGGAIAKSLSGGGERSVCKKRRPKCGVNSRRERSSSAPRASCSTGTALTEEEAYLRLRNESRRLRRPMRELAEAIILSEDLSRKSETL